MNAAKQKPVTLDELEETIRCLTADNIISPIQAQHLTLLIPDQFEESRYILKNAGAHLSIGIVFAFDVVPLPLGTIARVGWVAMARMRETLKGRRKKAQIHSLGVFLIAAIPWFGYTAYLLPLRKNNRELAYVLANHAWLERTGQFYEVFVSTKPNLVAKFARWMVPIPWSA